MGWFVKQMSDTLEQKACPNEKSMYFIELRRYWRHANPNYALEWGALIFRRTSMVRVCRAEYSPAHFPSPCVVKLPGFSSKQRKGVNQ
jgi:hypothetical protein